MSELFRWWQGWPWLGLLPLAWLGWTVFERARTRRARRVLGPRLATLTRDRDARAVRTRAALAGVALLALIVALLGPLGAPVVPLVPGAGLDLVVCLDVSRSMLARDVTPSRLEGARAALGQLAADAAGDRLALVTFAGAARLDVPLTHDLASWTMRLDDADPLTTARGGSDLGAALDVALQALPEASGRHGAILVVTDGEHQGADLDASVAALAERGVAVHTLVLGSPRGRRIPLPADGSDGDETFLVDRAGLEVLTRGDAATARQVSEPTGGRWLVHTDGDGVAARLRGWYDGTLRGRAREPVPDPSRATREELFQWPLLLAVLAGMLAASLSERRVVA